MCYCGVNYCSNTTTCNRAIPVKLCVPNRQPARLQKLEWIDIDIRMSISHKGIVRTITEYTTVYYSWQHFSYEGILSVQLLGVRCQSIREMYASVSGYLHGHGWCQVSTSHIKSFARLKSLSVPRSRYTITVLYRVVTMWGTRRSTTELEVSQAIRQIGCNNLQIERRTSKITPHRRGTWRFVILGEEQDIAYLEDNWKKMPKWWKLQCPASPKSSPDNYQQGLPFPEHLPRRPPIQTGMIQWCPPVQLRPHPFTYSPLPHLNYQR